MKHYGDITKLSGYELPVVDVITGGSPCQDLSVAGKRAGLDGERSGLFMDQIRIVKEMRKRDSDSGRTGQFVRPRWLVWENVPGAFSSSGKGTERGSDFAAVIEEIIKVCEPGAGVCVRVPDGGWTKSGCYYAEDGSWSIAWRVHDAQFWGVPQRRKRIALVADFGGLSAPEVLFERKGLSRDSEPSGTSGKETAGATGDGTKSASKCLNPWEIQQQRIQPIDGVAASVSAAEKRYRGIQSLVFDNKYESNPGATRVCVKSAEPILLESNQNHATVQTDGISTALPASMGMGGGYVPMVVETDGGVESASVKILNPVCYDARGNGDGEVAPTMTGDHQNRVTDYTALVCGNNQPLVVSDVLPFDTTQVTSDKNWSNPQYGDPCHPLAAQAHVPSIVSPSVVRRLTPLECERLQGFPDGWTDIGEWVDSKGKKHKEADSPRYKALGNSIALPFWQYLARRICAQYERNITMGSLFDGIGGFPLVFERCGAKAVWASEIEEFPIAVTKKHFPESTEDE